MEAKRGRDDDRPGDRRLDAPSGGGFRMPPRQGDQPAGADGLPTSYLVGPTDGNAGAGLVAARLSTEALSRSGRMGLQAVVGQWDVTAPHPHSPDHAAPGFSDEVARPPPMPGFGGPLPTRLNAGGAPPPPTHGVRPTTAEPPGLPPDINSATTGGPLTAEALKLLREHFATSSVSRRSIESFTRFVAESGAAAEAEKMTQVVDAIERKLALDLRANPGHTLSTFYAFDALLKQYRKTPVHGALVSRAIGLLHDYVPFHSYTSASGRIKPYARMVETWRKVLSDEGIAAARRLFDTAGETS